MRVFVDGESVLIDPKTRNPARPERACLYLPLGIGEHDIVIALDTAGGWGWGIYFAWVTPRLDLRLPNIPADEDDRPDNHAGA